MTLIQLARSIAAITACLMTAPLLGQETPRYAIVLLPSLGGEDAVAYGLNGQGEAVGRSDDALGRSRPTLWPLSGTPVDLGTLAGR